MPPDAPSPPSPRRHAPPSSRNAVRGGVLRRFPPRPWQGRRLRNRRRSPAPRVRSSPIAPSPSRGFGASLRAAARRGLLLARPLAPPFLHRLQMRMRTAVDESESSRGRWHRAAGEAVRAARGRGRRVPARHRGSRVADARRTRAASTATRAAKAALHRRAAAPSTPQCWTTRTRRRTRVASEGAAAGAWRTASRAGPLVPPRAPIPLGDEMMAWTPDGYLLLPAEDLRLLAAMSDGGVLETRHAPRAGRAPAVRAARSSTSARMWGP